MIKNFLLFCLSFSAQVMLAQGNSQGVGFSSFTGFSKSVPKANSKVDFFKDILKLILYFLLIVLIFVVIVKLIAFCPTSFAEKVGTSISKEVVPVFVAGFEDLKTTVQENGPALVQVAVDRAGENGKKAMQGAASGAWSGIRNGAQKFKMLITGGERNSDQVSDDDIDSNEIYYQ